MSSIVTGFEYDIFISYRHNDNLDGWVTDFVQTLEKELKSTIKEPLSIYFDKNPHDGLLETHSVDKSLEGKLKCLIFIPILSQTYCDTKSFAWEHEFCAFNRLSKEDSIGRDITLSNGNVASRILPVKIHDIDVDDKSTIENEIGGAIRAVEFIYKEPGVNRPLKPTDQKSENQNKTDYRNQINKVANAVKEIVGAATIKPAEAGHKQPVSVPVQRSRKAHYRNGLVGFSGLLIVAVLAYWLSSDTVKTTELDQSLDRAEQYLEEAERFGDKRYYENAGQVIQKVLAEDSLNERAIYLFTSLAWETDTADYFIDKLKRINPEGIYSRLAMAGRDAEKNRWTQARENLEGILNQDPENRDALGMLSFVCLSTQDYVNCYRYARRLEAVEAKTAHAVLSTLYLELGDFKEARRHLRVKQEKQEFACKDVEDLQRILLCQGDFQSLERLTDSLCNFSKCPDCDFWQLRAKLHVNKYDEAATFVGPSLNRMPKITWRYPAFVLQKTGRQDSALVVAQAEIEFDKMRLADSSYRQSMPLYSMAAIHAMQGNSAESLRWLRQYASKGFEMGSEWYIAHDPLFDEMQKDNEYFADFLQLIQKEQHRKTAIREDLRKLEEELDR